MPSSGSVQSSRLRLLAGAAGPRKAGRHYPAIAGIRPGELLVAVGIICFFRQWRWFGAASHGAGDDASGLCGRYPNRRRKDRFAGVFGRLAFLAPVELQDKVGHHARLARLGPPARKQGASNHDGSPTENPEL